MAIRLNWERVKQLHTELTEDGWKDSDQLSIIMIEKGGKPKKGTVIFRDFYKFFWELTDDDTVKVLTFIIQNKDGKILYRHKQVVGNEEVPIGGSSDVISHWAALTDDEKSTYITLLVAQIDAYER